MNTRIRVKALYIIETGTTNDMVSRSFTSHLDNIKMNQVIESTRGGEMVQAGNLAGVAGTIIMPSSEIDREVQIAGGWQQKRYRFVMQAVPDVGGLESSVQYIYTGYTNASGVVQLQNGGHDFAPDMQLFINNRIVLSTVAPNSLNQNGFFNVQNASHVIHPGTLGGLNRPSFNPMDLSPLQVPSTMRPTDLMHALSAQETSGMNERFVGDMRSAVTLALSRRTNQLPSNYLATSVDALHRAIQSEDPNQHIHGIYSSAAAQASEMLVYEDPLIGMISMNRTGYAELGYVRWDELKSILPELAVPGTVMVFGNDKAEKMDIYQSSHSNYQPWYQRQMNGQLQVDQSMEAIVSTYLLQTVPAIALQHLMSRVTFRATNMTADGQISVQVDPPVPLFGELPAGYIQSSVQNFVRNLEVNVLRDMPINSHIPFSIAVHLDVFGDSHVQVSMNGQPPVPYCSPTYADASFTPVVTSNHQNLNNVANDVKFLASNITNL